MVALCLKVTGTDTGLVVGQLLTLLGAMHVYLGLALLGVALGSLGRDRPSALVVLARCHIANLLVEFCWCP